MVILLRDFISNTAQFGPPLQSVYWTPGFDKLTIRSDNAAQYTRLIHTPGWIAPQASIADNFEASLRTLLSRQFQPTNPATITLASPANFCCMTSDANHSWFQFMIDTAATEASFIQGGTNMSHIPVLGKPEMLTETITSVQHPATSAIVRRLIFCKCWQSNLICIVIKIV